MLTQEDNDLMCHVGPGTAMGNLMRQYWMPALSPEDVQPDGPPLRLRLLCEDLIAFRDTSGRVGLIANSCPHRGASMFFGRNEEDGLRCVYHGWKFDTAGACVDMPSEPAESNFKSKVHAKSYPCVERNSVIWTYMGPRQVPPPMPDFLPNLSPDCRTTRSIRECSYMQALEGDIDTVHFGFLHAGHVKTEHLYAGGADYYAVRVKEAELHSYEHEIGTTYAAVRPGEEGTEYWRTGHYLLPFYTMNAPGVMPLKSAFNAWVPADDENTWVWNPIAVPEMQDPEEQGIGGLKVGLSSLRFDPIGKQGLLGQRGPTQFQPPTTAWQGKLRATANQHNDYLIDRELQSTMGTYTGLGGTEIQDRGIQESMGPVFDRTREHLGTSDLMVIRTRRKLINAAKALRDHGTVPPGVDQPWLYKMRSGGALLPRGVDGLEMLKDVHFMRSDGISLAAAQPA